MKKAVLLTAALITMLSAGVYVNAEENIDESVYISETGESESAAIIEEVPDESNDEKTSYAENPEIYSQTIQNGFVDENGVTYYYQNGVKVSNKEIYLDNNWYYFDANGKMAVGWTTHHGHRYYYDADGKMVHGIYVIGGEKYGFDEWTGVLLSGEHHFTNTEGNDWYYFDENGKMAVGWITHHGHQYYYDNNGIMAHGIYKIGNTKYGFDEWTGVLLSGEHYFTDGSDDHWYYFSEDAETKGQMKTGWITHHGNQYYYNEHGQMVHGIYKVGNIVYMFDEWLGIKRTGWVAYQGEWFYMDSNGSMYFGEHYMNGHWYYFDETTGITANKGLTKHHNHWYYYDENGYMQYGEKYIGTGWYYFNEYTGIMAIGWTSHHGNTYYYDENGQMVHGQVTIDGKKYIFDDVTGVLKGQARVYQNPSKYYQIKDYISLSGGGYNLSVGYEGLKVAYVKRALGLGNAVGLYGALYSQSVANYVKVFQRNSGLPQTGIVDLATWKAMGYSETDWYGLGAYVSPVRVNADSSRSDHIEAMIARAYEYLGTSYIIGASGAPGTGVDCSGLAMQALYAAGLDMSPINPVRHSYPGYEYESANMWASSKFKHVSYNERQRGDLIFYQNSSGAVIHVAIYLGNNQVIESWCAPFNKVVVQPITNAYRANIKGVARPFV